ncbi:hypothetical protein GPECTOR_26g530 [Gonium pectorale]|uniref:Uncharacterized protein n=1 Tax=Gonium pectorale TaxID=33097 RepID=A0A150GFJ4_GONPE|nr:hypothetical protein GPECTOR_26g530 [Gonium pectorale]|eukprot:KXZ48627.1 hypothetical protein GPECTOR_26g530 [Gonium pectorale]
MANSAAPNARGWSHGLLYCVSSLVLGIELNIVGPTAASLAAQVGVTEADLGGVVGLGGIGLLVGGIPAGWLLDRLPGHGVLASAAALQALSFLLLPHCARLAVLAATYCAAALTFNAITTGANALILWRYPAAHGAWLNLASALFGVGCFLAPVLADVAARVLPPGRHSSADGDGGGGPMAGAGAAAPFALRAGGAAPAYYAVAAGEGGADAGSGGGVGGLEPVVVAAGGAGSDQREWGSAASDATLGDAGPAAAKAPAAAAAGGGGGVPATKLAVLLAASDGSDDASALYGDASSGGFRTDADASSRNGSDDAYGSALSRSPATPNDEAAALAAAAAAPAVDGDDVAYGAADAGGGCAVVAGGGDILAAAAAQVKAMRSRQPAAAAAGGMNGGGGGGGKGRALLQRYIHELRMGWPVLLPVVLLLFANISTQASFGAWVTTYCRRAAGLGEPAAQAVTAAYWAAFTGTRLAGAAAAPVLHASSVLLITSPAAVAGAALAVLGLPKLLFPDASAAVPAAAAAFAAGLPLWALYAAVCLVGVGVATGFANAVSLTGDHLQLDGLTNGILSSVAGLASTLCPAAVPWLAGHTGMGYGSLMAVALVMSGAQLAMVLAAMWGARWVDEWARREEEEEEQEGEEGEGGGAVVVVVRRGGREAAGGELGVPLLLGEQRREGGGGAV